MPSEKDKLISTETKTLMLKAVEYVGGLEVILVDTDEQLENVSTLCSTIKKHKALMDEERKKIVGPLNTKVKSVNAEFREVTDKLHNGEVVLKAAMSSYMIEQERKAKAEAAKKEAEAEERRRKVQEQEQKEREKAAKYKAEGRQEMADKATARAEEKQSEAMYTIAEPVKEPVKLAKTSFKTDYKIEVTDKKKAALYLLSHTFLDPFVLIDIAALKKAVRASKNATQIPGIKVDEIKVPIVRKG